MKLIGEIIGYIAVLGAFLMFQQSKRSRLILCKLGIDILWIIHYTLLGGFTVVCTTSISVFRELIFYNRDKKLFESKFWLFLIIFLFMLVPFFTWEGWFSIFPVLSSIAATVSLWVKSVKQTKKISLFVSCSQIIYGICRNSYANITNELICIVSIFISFFKEHKKEEKLQ